MGKMGIHIMHYYRIMLSVDLPLDWFDMIALQMLHNIKCWIEAATKKNDASSQHSYNRRTNEKEHENSENIR